MDEMSKSNVTIIAAETDPARSNRLDRSLTLLGYQPVTVASAEEVMELIRNGVYELAVAAAELAWEGESIISRLSRLPSIRAVVAVGPPHDAAVEFAARTAGATAYLPRPVNLESLAHAIYLPARAESVLTNNKKNTASP